jgi:hypothetical protein
MHSPIPLYKGKANYEDFTKRILQKKIGHLEAVLDSSKNRFNFTVISFEISEKGNIENILLSQNYPSFLKDSTIQILASSNNNWQPAYANGMPIRKRILQPIIFEKGIGFPPKSYEPRLNENYYTSLDQILKYAFDFGNGTSNNYIDAILLPVILCAIIK